MTMIILTIASLLSVFGCGWALGVALKAADRKEAEAAAEVAREKELWKTLKSLNTPAF